MTASCSRRTFVAASSLAIARIRLGNPSLADAIPTRSRVRVSAFFPDLIDPQIIRRLALAGIDAAQRAGASYADLRIADSRKFSMFQSAVVTPYTAMDFAYTYGLRVRVGGAWTFAFGGNPTERALEQAAGRAVAQARTLAKLVPLAAPFAPAPVVRGEWATPIQIDPFSLTPNDHAELLGAYKEAAERVPDATVDRDGFVWTAESRVVASTEGSLTTQRLMWAEPSVHVQVWPHRKERTILPVLEIAPRSAGVECAMGPELQERIKVTAEEAARLAAYPEGSADVGRYDAVLDGTAVGALLSTTLVPALESERALGYDADIAGTSILTPIRDVMGRTMFSPHLTVIADRALPNYGAAVWDDEAVATQSFPVVSEGRIMTYFSTRASAHAFPVRKETNEVAQPLNGSAVSWEPKCPPKGQGVHLTIPAEQTGATLDALLTQLRDGVFIRGAVSIPSDRQCAGGILRPNMAYEVKRGRIVRRINGNVLQLSTKKFWSAMVAKGNTATVHRFVDSSVQDDAVRPVALSTPAAQFRQLDIVRLER